MDKLKSLRIDRGMTQAELAKQVGVQNTSICNYETGFRDPKISTLKKLASALDVTVDELLRDEDDESRTDQAA